MYAALASAEIEDDKVIKTAILARYHINTEAYCRRICTKTQSCEESFHELSI